jgi:hypothetical protein
LDDEVRARLLDEESRDRLIGSLEDGTVYSILESLKDLQTLKEKFIF